MHSVLIVGRCGGAKRCLKYKCFWFSFNRKHHSKQLRPTSELSLVSFWNGFVASHRNTNFLEFSQAWRVGALLDVPEIDNIFPIS